MTARQRDAGLACLMPGGMSEAFARSPWRPVQPRQRKGYTAIPDPISP